MGLLPDAMSNPPPRMYLRSPENGSPCMRIGSEGQNSYPLQTAFRGPIDASSDQPGEQPERVI